MKKIHKVSFAHYKKNIEKSCLSTKKERINFSHQNLIDAQKEYSLCGERKQPKTVPHEISTYNLTFSFKPLSANRKITLCTQQVAQC